MRTPLFFLAAALISTFATDANAIPQSFKVGDVDFSIDVPKSWNVQKEFFFPVSLVSPDNKLNKRSVIGITPTNEVDDQGIFEKGDKDITPFVEGRKEWLDTVDGKALSFDPYEKMQWKGIEAAHVLGYRYQIGQNKYYTRSYYILCNGGHLTHFKTLVAAEFENEHGTLIDKTVKTFQCKNTESVALNGGHK